MKKGANANDAAKIRKLTDQGKSVEFISGALGIIPECVKSFVDAHKANKKPAAKSAPKAKKAD